MDTPLSRSSFNPSFTLNERRGLASSRRRVGARARAAVCMFVVWTLICQSSAPDFGRVQSSSPGSTVEASRHDKAEAGWMARLARSVMSPVGDAEPAPSLTLQTDTLTDAVISRSHPNISSGRIEGSLRVLQAQSFAIGGGPQIWGDIFLPGTPSIHLNGGAQHGGVVTSGGATLPNYSLTLSGGIVLPGKIHIHTNAASLPHDFPSFVPAAAGSRSVTVNSQSDIASIGNWQTVRDLSVTKAGVTINVPPGNYGAFTVNGNSRLNFTAGTYNFANAFNLDGSASLQATGLVTINVGENLTINSGALVLGAYTAPGDVHLNVLGSALKVNGSSQVSGMVRAYKGVVTLNGASQVRGQIIADSFTLNGGKVIGAVWPARTSSGVTTFGPRRFDRTVGPPNQYLEQFSLPAGVTSPYTLHLQNGEPNGSNRLSSATVKLNGKEILLQSDLNQNVASLDRTVSLNSTNRLEVRLTSDPGSYLIINIAGVSVPTDNAPPLLSITQPANNSSTASETINVSGTAADTGNPASGVAHVYVNGVEAILNTANATWSISDVPLSVGANRITVRGVDVAGNEATTSINVTREAENGPPTADAGADQILTLPQTASLQGAAADDGLPAGSSLSTTWSVVSNPGSVAFKDINSLQTVASFGASGTYVLRLTASDGDLSASDDITITVQPQNQPPTVSAGQNQTIALPRTATLNGTVSDDGLPAGGTLTSQWSQVSGRGTTTFEYPLLSETVASFSAAGLYVLRLTATDGDLTASGEVTITVGPENHAPLVDAGSDQSITLPNILTLNGSTSDDGLPVDSIIATNWTKVSGPGTVTFGNSNVTVTSATFSEAGIYVLRLTASDSEFTSHDEILITVLPQNFGPTASAGTDQTIVLPAQANLYGNVNDDGLPAAGALLATWSKLTGPGDVMFSNVIGAVTSATFSAPGIYVLRLTASDSELTATDDVQVIVLPQNLAPAINAGPDQTVSYLTNANLNGSVSDDGLPSGSPLTTEWSQVSGPGVVTFVNPAVSVTSASFSLAGTYVLRLTASDTELTSFDDVTITVMDMRVPPNADFVVAESVDSIISLRGQHSVALAQSPGLITNGAAIFRSSYPGGDVSPNGLLGYNNGGWAPTIASHPYAIIQLAGGDLHTLKGVKIASMHAVFAQTIEYAVRNFEVWVSSTTPDDASFAKVLTATAALNPALQTFMFPGGPVQARYVKYVPLTNGGSPVVNTQAFDVIAERMGQLVASSAQIQSNFNPPEAALDFDDNSIWFSPGGATTSVWLKTSLANQQNHKIYGVRIYPVNDFTNGQRGPRDFDIRVATDNTDDASFTTVYSGTLAGTFNAGPQEVLFPALVDAKYVQFFWKNSYSTSNIGVRSVEVLAAPTRGAAVVGVSSQESPATNALDLDTGNQWITALNQPASQWIKLLLARGELASLHRIALQPAIAGNGNYSAPKDFELQVSTTDSADASFTSVLAATLANSTQVQDFQFAPVQARYVRLLLKTNYGGGGRYGLSSFYLYSADQIGSTTRFIDHSTDTDGTIVEWSWNFGDGTTSSEAHPTHTFAAPGDYAVSLTVTDNSGLSHTRQSVYHVVAPAHADFAFSPVIAHEGGETVRFTDLTQLLSGPNTSRRFDFGDGATATQVTTQGFHRFDDSGTFPVTMRIGNSLGVDYQVTKNIVVLNMTPTVDVPAGKTLVWGEQWTSVPAINDQSPVDRLTLQGQWNFGDGQTSTCTNCTNANATVTHAYSNPGIYTSVLTVTDKDGASASDSATFSVNKRPISLAFQTETIAAPELGQLVPLRVRLVDRFANQPLPGRSILLNLNGATANAVTDVHGFAEASVTFAAGRGANTATATFAEEEFYLGGSTYRLLPGAANPQTCSRSSTGPDFWLMFPGNHVERAPSEQEGTFLDISSEVATTGTVTVPGLNITKTFSVAAHSTTRVQVNTEVTNNNLVENRGIHVVTQHPVTVYGLNNQFATVDAYLGLPTASLGNNYVVLGYANGGVLKGTQFGIVASAAATTVTITPAVTVGSRTAGVPYTLTLNQGQTYMLRDDVGAKSDLSGTFIQSNKPIAVFGGHRCANIPVPISYCDYVVEQLPPVDTWGTHFATLPLASRTKGDTFRFLAATDNTHVFLDSSRIATLNRGQFFERIIEGSAEITSDHPILVAQYSNSHQYDNGLGDPFMMLVPPLDHYLTAYTITSPGGFNPNFINVVAPTSDIGAVMFDGAPIPASSFAPIGNTGASGARLTVSAAAHKLSGPHPFGVYVYGFGLDVSYGYPGSSCLSSVPGPTSITLAPKSQNATIGAESCITATVRDQNNTPVNNQNVSFAITGAHSQTSPSKVTNALGEVRFCYTAATAGDDLINATSSGASDSASISWRVPNQPPIVNAGLDQTITMPAPAGLSGSATDDGLPISTLTYLWAKVSGPGNVVFTNAVSPTTTATFDTSGLYVLRLTASDSELTAGDEVEVTVNPAPLNQPPTASAGPDLTATINGNLITNGGNEEQMVNGRIAGWTEVEGSSWTQGLANFASGFPEPNRGTAYFFANDAPRAELRQDVDVSAYAGNIAAGTQRFEFKTYVRSAAETTPDAARVVVEYRDASNTSVIATLDSGEITSTNFWHLTEDIRTVPYGTGWIRVRLIATRNSGATNDAFFDSATLRPAGNAAVKLNGTATDDGLPYGSALNSTWTTISGPGVVNFSQPNSPVSAATFNTAGIYVLRLTASDAEATISDDVAVVVNPANQAPLVRAGANQTITMPAGANLSGLVSDDGQPPGNSLSINWSKLSGSGTVTFANAGDAATSVSFSTAGTYVLRLTADDAEYSSFADVSITVDPAPVQVNQPPAVNPGPNQTISLPANSVTLNGTATDDALPAGSTLTVTWIQVSGPATVTFDTPNNAVTTARFSAVGSYVLRLSASDGAYLVSAEVGVILTPQNQPPTANAGTDQTVLLSPGAQLNGSCSDDGLPQGTLTTIWSKVSGPGTVTFTNPNITVTRATFSAVGTYVLRLTAGDGALNATDELTIVVVNDVAPPEVEITSPADGNELTEPATVTGSVSNGAWALEYSLNAEDGAANQVWTEVASGTGPIANSPLGTLDTTLMLNGIYSLRLKATDQYGQISFTNISVLVDKNFKVGQFQVAFSDLNVPVAGVPIEVIRSYDSRDKRVGDFGAGWQLGLRSARLEKTGILGFGWHQTATSGASPTYCLEPSRPHKVAITFADGKVFKFRASTAIHCQQLAPISATHLTFTAEPGTHATLESTSATDVLVEVQGSIPGPVRLINQSNPDIYNTGTFRLTTAEGAVYVIDQRTGVNSVRDPYGNTLTVGAGGIVHSSGKSISFTRDGAGRITQITDPNGNSQTYVYDENGDLTSYTDREQQTTTFTYNSKHHLLSITDARGVELLTNEYDASGRLIGQTDAFSESLVYDHDVVGRVETITDRLGHSSRYEYDGRGNVLRQVDARDGVKTFTYDAFDNVLTETNALGKTITYTYDAADNRTSVTDPLGNRTTLTYNTARQPLTVTDARGNVTTNTYDASGTNLLTTTDPLSRTTTFGYSIFTGQRTAMKDALNHVTQYAYDNAGRLLSETDALGHVTTFGYDSNGNRTTQTVTRTNAHGEIESIVTTYTYDKLNRLTKTTFADGSITGVEYNALGQQAATIDQLGHRTEFSYDAMGRLIRTDYPDSTHEETTYDAEGRRLTSKDRAGRVTSFTYDELGRLTKTTYPDNTFTSTSYDATGQVLATTDARGNVTRFEYDGAGRRTKVKNALNQETTFTYDANGNQLTMNDALHHITAFEYDDNNRRTKTTYHDGSFETVGYDPLGRSVFKTDQAGKTTQFIYDALGRLTRVKDALNQETSYAYNELGQQIAQTDANNHTTRFEYDQLGRRLKRILPAGQFETYSYDTAGNLQSRTDFNGKTTTFNYDAMRRLLTKVPDSSLNQPAISFTYNLSGRRATMNDASGVTVYNYDARHRLASKQTPFGTLSYTYDDSGNLLTTRSSNANGTSVDYNYDPLNRLATVKDNNLLTLNGGSTSYSYDPVGNLKSYLYPNGVTTTYDFNSLNRLTSSNASTPVSTLANYTYTLGATGNRTAVIELSGRKVNYAYDDLYRLTNESIANDTHGINGTLSYAYDPVGNRLSRTSSVAGVASQSSTYDDNDRLTSDAYDANGNTKTSNGGTYDYDFEDRLITHNSSVINGFVYDGDGNRVAKTVGGVTTNYLVDTNNHTGYAQVVEELQGGAVTKQFTYGHDLISQRCAPLTANCSISFYGYDGHGSVRFLTDTSAAVTDTYTYDAFGNLISRTGTTSNDYLYSGEQLDANLGFYYLRARYMNPSSGRFWSMDSYEGGSSDPRSLHKFVYAYNRPVDVVDPSGQIGVGSVIGELNAVSWRACLFIGQFQRSIAGANLILKLLDVGLTFGDTEYRDTSLSTGHNPFLSLASLALDARTAFRFAPAIAETASLYRRAGMAADRLVIANPAASLPEQQLANFTRWSANPTVVQEGETLYRIHGPGRATGPWWSRIKPQSRIQLRIDAALRPEWNEATQLSTMTVPKDQGLKGWEGTASYQGDFYIGGKNQLYVPSPPSDWITTVPFP